MVTEEPQQQTFWQRTKAASKKGYDKVYYTVDKLGAPINRLSNRLGAEAFWPTSLDKESDKAARILRSFCKDGFYAGLDAKAAEKAVEAGEKVEGPQGKQRVLKKIPTEVIRNAKGLAIFTTMRTGLWVSGAGGSGILIARTGEDGTGPWSGPSGIMLHTAGLGFLVGVDIYDCVVVINTAEALEAFTKVRCTLGGEVSAVAGPVGIGGVMDTEVHKRRAPIWTYLKSRGFYAGVQVDGTIVIERMDENEKFYGEKIGVKDILAGKTRKVPESTHMLMATLAAAQGDEIDESELPAAGSAPGDQEIIEGTTFGVPDAEDEDPYGVKALEKEGLEIKEAGTGHRPSLDVFEFRPSPASPIYDTFTRNARASVDGHGLKRDSWRRSTQSFSSIDRGTQTDDDPPTSARSGRSISHSPVKNNVEASPTKITERTDDYNVGSEDQFNGNNNSNHSLSQSHGPDEETASASPQRLSRARVVTIPKRVPPALPPRNPGRNSSGGPIVVNASPANEDFSPVVSSPAPIQENSNNKGNGFHDISLGYDDDPDTGADNRRRRSGSIGSHEADEVTDAWREIEKGRRQQEQPQQEKEKENDEFHSIPTTPVETRDRRDDDFS